jgi:hypothetical protein
MKRKRPEEEPTDYGILDMVSVPDIINLMVQYMPHYVPLFLKNTCKSAHEIITNYYLSNFGATTDDGYTGNQEKSTIKLGRKLIKIKSQRDFNYLWKSKNFIKHFWKKVIPDISKTNLKNLFLWFTSSFGTDLPISYIYAIMSYGSADSVTLLYDTDIIRCSGGLSTIPYYYKAAEKANIQVLKQLIELMIDGPEKLYFSANSQKSFGRIESIKNYLLQSYKYRVCKIKIKGLITLCIGNFKIGYFVFEGILDIS